MIHLAIDAVDVGEGGKQEQSLIHLVPAAGSEYGDVFPEPCCACEGESLVVMARVSALAVIRNGLVGVMLVLESAEAVQVACGSCGHRDAVGLFAYRDG